MTYDLVPGPAQRLGCDSEVDDLDLAPNATVDADVKHMLEDAGRKVEEKTFKNLASGWFFLLHEGHGIGSCSVRYPGLPLI